jgi:tryptophanyl-tRNA synthetase
MSRRITGFQPTGPLHLGNYVGAIRPVLDDRHRTQTTVFIADLHAMTVTHDPRRLGPLTFDVAALLLAAGVDPARTTLYVQSDVSAHTALHYLLECTTSYGEAHRMIQFKEKGGGSGTRLSLLTYPVLQAADILLHDIDEVPVGVDQGQHVELTRDVARRFNTTYGETFVVPRAAYPPFAARLADLSDPGVKMSKSNASASGVLLLLDEPDVLRRKVMRAVTDGETEVRYAPQTKPGVSNLLEILACCTGGRPAQLADQFTAYGTLKAAVADAVVDLLRPIQRRYRELTADRGYVQQVLAEGAERARGRADATLARARAAIGLSDRPAAGLIPMTTAQP